MVSQLIFYVYDIYFFYLYFMFYILSVFIGGNYVGVFYFYGSGWGMGGDMYGFYSVFGKLDVVKVYKK